MSLIGKIWTMIKLLKAGTYDKVADAVIPLVVENKMVAPFLARNKTIIGFILVIAYEALKYYSVTFPAQPWIEPAVLILGLVLTALGIAHRGVKDRLVSSSIG